MSKIGGYKIIDFSKFGAFTSGVEKTCGGVYEAIESTNKRIVISGLEIGSVELDDIDVNFISDSSVFKCIVWYLDDMYITIEVAADDGITVTEVTVTANKKK